MGRVSGSAGKQQASPPPPPGLTAPRRCQSRRSPWPWWLQPPPPHTPVTCRPAGRQPLSSWQTRVDVRAARLASSSSGSSCHPSPCMPVSQHCRQLWQRPTRAASPSLLQPARHAALRRAAPPVWCPRTGAAGARARRCWSAPTPACGCPGRPRCGPTPPRRWRERGQSLGGGRSRAAGGSEPSGKPRRGARRRVRCRCRPRPARLRGAGLLRGGLGGPVHQVRGAGSCARAAGALERILQAAHVGDAADVPQPTPRTLRQHCRLGSRLEGGQGALCQPQQGLLGGAQQSEHCSCWPCGDQPPCDLLTAKGANFG